MAVNITDINIASNAALDQDVIQEIGFLGEEKLDYFQYEEQKDLLVGPHTQVQISEQDCLFALREQEELMDQGAREHYGICEVCNGTGSYWDCGPHISRKEPCDNCNGTGNIKDRNEE